MENDIGLGDDLLTIICLENKQKSTSYYLLSSKQANSTSYSCCSLQLPINAFVQHYLLIIITICKGGYQIGVPYYQKHIVISSLTSVTAEIDSDIQYHSICSLWCICSLASVMYIFEQLFGVANTVKNSFSNCK